MWVFRHLEDTLLDILVSFLASFAAYFAAEQMHVSGDLFELPKNVREAAEFRRDSLLNPEQRRAVLVKHLSRWHVVRYHAPR